MNPTPARWIRSIRNPIITALSSFSSPLFLFAILSLNKYIRMATHLALACLAVATHFAAGGTSPRGHCGHQRADEREAGRYCERKTGSMSKFVHSCNFLWRWLRVPTFCIAGAGARSRGCYSAVVLPYAPIARPAHAGRALPSFLRPSRYTWR